jgi:hypothetical protein
MITLACLQIQGICLENDHHKDDNVEDQDEDVSLFNLFIVHLFHHVSISRLYV